MSKLSVIILVKNEAKNLLQLLPTLSWADEIIVINDFSTDQTRHVCSKFHTRVINYHLNHDFSQVRNFAVSKARFPWILFIDADERLSTSLINSIIQITSSTLPKKNQGYAIKRTDVFMNKTLLYGETGNQWLVRLSSKKGGQWENQVHEIWQVKQTIKLSGNLLHYSHPYVSQLFFIVHQYALFKAQELLDRRQYFDLFAQIFYPPLKFCYTYFIKLGFLDGIPGLLMSLAMAYHSLLVRYYSWSLALHNSNFLNLIRSYLWITIWLLLPFGQLNRAQLSPQVAIYVFEIFMGLFLLFTPPTITQFRLWPKTTLFSATLLFSYLISVINNIGSPLAGLYWCRWCLYVLFFISSFSQIKANKLKVNIAGIINYLLMVTLFAGILQYFIFPDTIWLKYLGWDDHYFRQIGLLFDPNFQGLILVLGLSWLLTYPQQLLTKLTAPLLVFAIITTYSRITYFLTVIVLFTYIKNFRLYVKNLIFIISLTIISFLLIPKPGGEGVNLFRINSIRARINSQINSWPLFISHPLTGIGFNQYPYYFPPLNSLNTPYHPKAPDNSILFVLITAGIMGITTLFLMLREWQYYLASHSLSLTLVIIHSLVNHSLFYPWVLLWIFLLMMENRTPFNGNNKPPAL